MATEESTVPRTRRRWLRRVGWSLLGLIVLLAVFHRPILQSIGRKAAINLAAKQNLKLDFQLEGSVLGDLELRNVRATPSGPSAVESVDIGKVKLDYSPAKLLGGDASRVLEEVQLENARIVLDPGKAPTPPPAPKERKKGASLPPLPERIVLRDVTVIIRARPKDIIVEDLDLTLVPGQPGALTIETLQLGALQTWQDLAATTSYDNRNLLLRDLGLGEFAQIRLLNVDASALENGTLKLALDAALAGGEVDLTATLHEKEASLQTELSLETQNILLAEVGRLLGRAPDQFNGTVQRLAINGSGLLNRPQSWNGSIVARIDNPTVSGISLERATVLLNAREGAAVLEGAEIRKGSNVVLLQGRTDLPQRLGGFGRAPAELTLKASLPDLQAIAGGLPQPVTGAVDVTGEFKIASGVIDGAINLEANALEFGDKRVGRGRLTVRGTKRLSGEEAQEQPYYENLQTDIAGSILDGQAAGLALDSIEFTARSKDEVATLQQAVAVRGENRVVAEGSYRLPLRNEPPLKQPAVVRLDAQLPQLGQFWVDETNPNRLTGRLQAYAYVDVEGGRVRGSLNVYGSEMIFRQLEIETVSTEATLASNVVYLNDLRAQLNESDSIVGHGSFSLDKPHNYSGELHARIAELSEFESLVARGDKKVQLAGNLSFDWQGRGEAGGFPGTGDLRFALENGRYADLQDLEARIEAQYTRETLQVPLIYLGSDRLILQASAVAQERTLQISEMQIYQGESKYGVGYVSVPFVWEHVGTSRPLIPPQGPVEINIQSENIDIAKLFRDFGMDAPASGLVNTDINLTGTLSDLTGTIKLNARQLASETLEGLEPATFDLEARLQDEQVVIDGELRQTRLQPISIDAQMPLDLGRIIQQRALPDEVPVTASIQMPPSSVNFVRQFVPDVATIDGTAAIDVRINGTVADPVFTGSATMDVNVMRFADTTLPTIRDFQARLSFDGDTLNFSQFGGELAGGRFAVNGRVEFPKLTEPVLNLRVTADSALVARDEELTVRADANVSVSGPLKTAAVSGDIALTNSHLFKNIDLIPIGLPGRPAPQPASTETRTLDLPKFVSDWTFNLAIKTDEPFKVRGNLANGAAIVDLKLTGSGAEPQLQGFVRLNDVAATLPFSRLEIDRGFLFFQADEALNPRLDLHGTSVIRDYTVHVNIYGTLSTPEVLFRSEPPLPQEDIISLLATGTTREELVGSNNVLAGRAAILLFQELYRKVFKKEGEPKETQSIWDRLQVEIGEIDPKTGQQSALARYRVDNNWVIIGEVGVRGDFNGKVRYMLRFR